MPESPLPATPSRDGVPSVLRQLARPRTAREHCELCSAELGSVHSHLLEPERRQILCACEACSLLFCRPSGGARFLRIPHRTMLLKDFSITDLEWESLMIPINLAFFYHDSAAGKVRAMYPSPAGATESLLSLESWEDIRTQSRVLRSMEPDVEAFLVNRVNHRLGGEAQYFLVPIDSCYELVGLIRLHWKGLSGGAEVWQRIAEFFATLRARAGHSTSSGAEKQNA
jgi:hypothetical protein